MSKLRALPLMGLLFMVGCSFGPADNPQEVNAPPATADIKLVLDEVIATGNPLGSQGYTLEMKIAELKESDPAKADKLNAAYLELRDMNNAAQLKAKAKEMLEML